MLKLAAFGYHHSNGISGAGADDILISTYEKPESSLHGNDSSIAMNCHKITTDATYNPWYGRAVRALTQTRYHVTRIRPMIARITHDQFQKDKPPERDDRIEQNLAIAFHIYRSNSVISTGI